MKTITVSDETWRKIRKEVGKEKKKFKPISIHLDCFIVNVENGSLKITTGSNYNDICCHQRPCDARHFIEALQSAIDYIENET